MKILISPDKFKESFTAYEVAQRIYKGIQIALPGSDCRIIPVADGGEGTVNALISATQGTRIHVEVADPLMRKVNASYGISSDGQIAFIEMASASGIALLESHERNPMVTTSYGTGEIIKTAIERGCREMIIGLGGSATVDGGVGMARALGVRFTDESGNDIPHGGGSLGALRHIDVSGINPTLSKCKIIVACDVTNILSGPEGASYVFGPQKGADDRMVRILDENLRHLSNLISEQLQIDISNIRGGGAAGGMGAGMVAFLGAKIRNGFEVVAEYSQLESSVKWADVVITGEGKIDSQTAFGKAPAGVARMASKHGKPVIAFAGTLGPGFEELYKSGFTAIFSVADKPMTLEQSIKRTGELIEGTAERIFRLIRAILNISKP